MLKVFTTVLLFSGLVATAQAETSKFPIQKILSGRGVHLEYSDSGLSRAVTCSRMELSAFPADGFSEGTVNVKVQCFYIGPDGQDSTPVKPIDGKIYGYGGFDGIVGQYNDERISTSDDYGASVQVRRLKDGCYLLNFSRRGSTFSSDCLK